MAATDNADALSSEEAQRLADFARACKAAARVVALYPATHPAIQSALSRVSDAGTRLRANGVASLTVRPDVVLLGGRGSEKPDSAIGELATLLHAHLIGELNLVGDLPPAHWRTFLLLLARSAEEVRAEGGIAQAWATAGGGPIELRLIDYGEVLRERTGGLEGDWEQIIANYLEGEADSLDDKAMAALFEIAEDANQFKDFTERLAARAAEGSVRGKKEIVLRVLQALADFVAKNHPDQLDRILHQIAGSIPRLSPELVVTLITTGVPTTGVGDRPGIDLPGEVRARMSDQTVAEFVAHSVSRDQGATQRLAQAFTALVPESEKRAELLEMAQAEAAKLPIGKEEGFPDLWKSAADLITSYSDSNFVSDEYGKELSTARAHAVEVERVSDDPPERVSAWLATVSEKEVRRLDQQVLIDLLAIEKRPEAWQKVLDSALITVDQLVVAGELSHAQRLLEAIIAAGQDDAPFAADATKGLERLRSGPLMKHVVVFVRTAQEAELKMIAEFCRMLGPTVIGPIAEALAVEQGGAVRRLRELVMSFGAAGRAYADELRTSANPAVRRTAIELLRAFGGKDALPDLARLLDDAEPAVQREALRAIVQIGTNDAYATLEKALKSGTPRTRDAIMQVLSSSRDERAAPLFVYILEKSDHRGSFETVYISAIEALGKLGGEQASVDALKKVLFRGEWWAPGRTSRIRAAAALALRASGSPPADEVLSAAAESGPRGVRRAARAALAAPAPRAAVRRPT